jgi:rhizosphere induced protein
MNENSLAADGGVTYTVNFINNSVDQGDVCIFQQDPDISNPNVLSLAWFSKLVFPTTTVKFQWQINYSFVWGETGTLVPGVLFDASQTWGADLSTNNKVTLAYQGAYTFENQTKGPQPGTLYIAEDSSLPINQASVGIGMSGAGTFVVQAQPRLNLTFTPHPRYWIAFGNFTQGQVLDIGQISNPFELDFPPNVYSITVTLNADNTWSESTTPEANAHFLRAKSKDPKALWGAY